MEPSFVAKDSAVYKTPAHQIQSGDLLAWDYVDSKGLSRFVKKFVQLMTLSDYAHVGIAIVKDDILHVFEAREPVIEITPLVNRGSFYVVPMNLTDTTNLQQVMERYVGKKYSLVDCVRAYLGYETNSNDSWQCAEVANQVYIDMGIELNPVKTTPGGVVKAAILYSKTGLWIF